MTSLGHSELISHGSSTNASHTSICKYIQIGFHTTHAQPGISEWGGKRIRKQDKSGFSGGWTLKRAAIICRNEQREFPENPIRYDSQHKCQKSTLDSWMGN